MRKVMLEQKSLIEGLSKKEVENQQTIDIFQDRLKAIQGISLSCVRFRPLLMYGSNFELNDFFCVRELLAKRPSVDEISAQLKTLHAEHESLQATLKESQLNETKPKKELETKHEQAMSELREKLKPAKTESRLWHQN
jgi:uncharacterized coiled-coil protein SlyX